MITEACILIGGAVGAIAGAALSSTEKGEELNDRLDDAFGTFDDNDSDSLPDDTYRIILWKLITNFM